LLEKWRTKHAQKEINFPSLGFGGGRCHRLGRRKWLCCRPDRGESPAGPELGNWQLNSDLSDDPAQAMAAMQGDRRG